MLAKHYREAGDIEKLDYLKKVFESKLEIGLDLKREKEIQSIFFQNGSTK
jgi:hypothetical protein